MATPWGAHILPSQNRPRVCPRGKSLPAMGPVRRACDGHALPATGASFRFASARVSQANPSTGLATTVGQANRSKSARQGPTLDRGCVAAIECRRSNAHRWMPPGANARKIGLPFPLIATTAAFEGDVLGVIALTLGGRCAALALRPGVRPHELDCPIFTQPRLQELINGPTLPLNEKPDEQAVAGIEAIFYSHRVIDRSVVKRVPQLLK